MSEANRGVRRRHSAELRQRILAQCKEPGASVARVALAHGINANLLHRWRQQSRKSDRGTERGAIVSESFIPVALAATVPASAAVIRIELRRGASAVSVQWPVAAASECAAWMREWLK